MAETKSLAEGLVAAQNAVSAVAKDATNTFHKYKYASAESLIEEGRQALTSGGLSLMAFSWAFEPSADTSGKVIGRVKVKYHLTHLCGESRDWECSTPVIPENGRPPDKAEFAAITENLGYTLRGLLLIPRQDAADISSRDDREYKPKKEENPTEKPVVKKAAPKEEKPATVPADARAKIEGATTVEELDKMISDRVFEKYSEAERALLKPIFRVKKEALVKGSAA